jgi:cell wall-associated NlpC family hydrolase
LALVLRSSTTIRPLAAIVALVAGATPGVASAKERQQWAVAAANSVRQHMPVVRGQQAARFAKAFLGTPYRWGGASPAGFDCSGLSSYVYAKFGVRMDHYTGSQWEAFRKVPRKRLRQGDLVFFSGLSHMGIYVGRGRFIHAPHTGDVVRISRLDESWYARSYVGAVRPA